MPTLMQAAVRLRRDPRACSPPASRCASTRCMRSRGPMRMRSSSASSARPRARCVNGTPLPDFGGHHPDPNLVHAKDLLRPDDGAGRAGPRRGLGRRWRPQPDHRPRHLRHALGLAGHAGRQCASGAGLRARHRGHCALDADQRRGRPRRRRSSASPCYETPTGWKFFGNLLDAGRVTICGEESAGTGSDHVREKDGLWAVLLWLNILAARKQSVQQIAREHWAALRPQLLHAARLRRRRQRRRERR